MMYSLCTGLTDVQCVYWSDTAVFIGRVWRGGCIGCCYGNRRERAHWEDLGVDGWIIFGWISRKWYVGIWTGLGRPRIEIVGGRL